MPSLAPVRPVWHLPRAKVHGEKCKTMQDQTTPFPREEQPQIEKSFCLPTSTPRKAKTKETVRKHGENGKPPASIRCGETSFVGTSFPAIHRVSLSAAPLHEFLVVQAAVLGSAAVGEARHRPGRTKKYMIYWILYELLLYGQDTQLNLFNLFIWHYMANHVSPKTVFRPQLIVKPKKLNIRFPLVVPTMNGGVSSLKERPIPSKHPWPIPLHFSQFHA